MAECQRENDERNLLLAKWVKEPVDIDQLSRSLDLILTDWPTAFISGQPEQFVIAMPFNLCINILFESYALTLFTTSAKYL